jgi:dCTP deaminase
MLNDKQITDSKIITPFNPVLLQPHSYDATLDTIVKVAWYNEELMERGWLEYNCDTDSMWLHPGQFALASTKEFFTLPQNIVGFVQGKSSVGRNGLQIENAGLIDAGFSGAITLELYNMAPWPIKLQAGMAICQIHFTEVESPVYKDYAKTGHYNGQKGPTQAVYSI